MGVWTSQDHIRKNSYPAGSPSIVAGIEADAAIRRLPHPANTGVALLDRLLTPCELALEMHMVQMTGTHTSGIGERKVLGVE